jgi:DNA-binding transcriptional MerR regulator
MLEQLGLFTETATQENEVKEPITTTTTSAMPERKLVPPAVLLAAEVPKTPERIVATSIKKNKQEKSVKSTRGRKSIKEMSMDAELVEIPADDILFQKQYYGIGEVATMFHVNASLLRYWESEFDILKPRKNRKGDRFFRPEDIKNLEVIYHLLRQRKYTIEGAKEFLKNNKKTKEKFEILQSLQKVRAFMLELKAAL